MRERAEIRAQLSAGTSENLSIEIDGKRLRLSHLNKVYFPQPRYTKRDLLFYYFQMAGYILPFLKDRPLVLRRYPDGVTGHPFFQKDLSRGLPNWFPTVEVESQGKRDVVRYGMANDLASLLYLTNLGCIDHNPWSSRCDDLQHPDYFFFDLDPSEGTGFETVLEVGRQLVNYLEKIQARYFLKTSGATGLHIYLPFQRRYSYEQLRAFGDVLAHLVASELPGRVTFERRVAKRPRGSVLIDVTQNSEGRPLAAVYCARAFPQATVSAPVSARELRSGLDPGAFTIKTMPGRVKQKGDLWADFWNRRQRIEPAVAKLSALLGR